MERNKNIDKVFRERFTDLEIDPGRDGWPRLEKRLAGNARNRRLILIRWSSMAVALLLILSTGYFWRAQQDQHLLHSPVEESVQNTPERVESQGSPQKPGKAAVVDSNEDASKFDEVTGISASSYEWKSAQAAAAPYSETGSSSEMTPRSLESGHVYADGSNTRQISQKPEFPPAPLLPDTMLYPSQSCSIQTLKCSRDLKACMVSPAIELSRFTLGVYISPCLGFSRVNIQDPEDVAAVNSGNDLVMPTLTAGLELEYRSKGRWSFAAGIFASQ